MTPEQRIGLIGCVKQKRTTSSPARDLYVSPLFVGRRRYVEGTCGRWFVLSAAHGLVDPERTLEPYDETLKDASPTRRRAWSEDVVADLDRALGGVEGRVFEIHAGAAYRGFGLVDGLQHRGATVEVPAAGLGIGQQLAFYGGRAPEMQSHSPRPTPRAGGAYATLASLLERCGDTRASFGFAELGRLIGRPLPTSAGKHRAWWANDASHTQGSAWLGAGWRVAAVDLNSRRVTFERAR